MAERSAAPGARTADTLSLTVSRVFDAPPEKVFAAWTKPEALKLWLAPGPAEVESAQVDLRVGGSYRIHIRGPDGKPWIATGVYREIRAPERLVFTWVWEHEPDIRDMVITTEFRDLGGRTELVLTHEGFPNEESKKGHQIGWDACLPKLPLAL